MKYPLALICRDNVHLDVYNLETGKCVKSLRHESKVMNNVLNLEIKAENIKL